MADTESSKCLQCGCAVPAAVCKVAECVYEVCRECGLVGECLDPECVNRITVAQAMKLSQMLTAKQKNSEFKFGF